MYDSIEEAISTWVVGEIVARRRDDFGGEVIIFQPDKSTQRFSVLRVFSMLSGAYAASLDHADMTTKSAMQFALNHNDT